MKLDEKAADVLYDRLKNFRDRLDTIERMMETENIDGVALYDNLDNLQDLIQDILDRGQSV